jgi:hypothetical protein
MSPSKIGRPRTCECGTCAKCKKREYQRGYWQTLSIEERRAIIAKRDPERTRAAERARYYRHRESRLALMREWRENNLERSRELKREWAGRNPEKRKAQWAVNNAIRDGRMVRQPCEVCGEKAQAHHDDYSKPFDVRWLCTTHHGEVHRRYAA